MFSTVVVSFPQCLLFHFFFLSFSKKKNSCSTVIRLKHFWIFGVSEIGRCFDHFSRLTLRHQQTKMKKRKRREKEVKHFSLFQMIWVSFLDMLYFARHRQATTTAYRVGSFVKTFTWLYVWTLFSFLSACTHFPPFKFFKRILWTE